VYKRNKSLHEILIETAAVVTQANNYFALRSIIQRPYDKMLNRLSQAGELEFLNPSNKIELALGYSEVNKPREAKFWLNNVEEHGRFLDQQIGDKRVIFSDREFEDIIISFREESPGFEDPYDQKLDSIQQIYNNQQDRTKH
jgi:hypothetical protein